MNWVKSAAKLLSAAFKSHGESCPRDNPRSGGHDEVHHQSRLVGRNASRRLMRFRQGESGQTLVLAAVCIPLVLGFVAMAVDIGLLFRAKRNLQIAADAGAINAAAELSAGDWSAAGKAGSCNERTDGWGQ